MKSTRWLSVLFLASISISRAYPQAKPKRITGEVVPGTNWQQAAPESVSFSSSKLEALRGWLKTQDTGSMMVIAQGRVIFSYGDVSHASKLASARKSVLGMLYGNYVASGKIDLSKTVKQLGLDDKQPFSRTEEQATLEQLLASRSGIYLPNGSLGQNDYMPKRNSEDPGVHYVYNNWDFDAAGVAFENQTGRDIYDALRTDLVVPLGMQDYRPSLQKKEYTPDSLHAEYVMRLSARDMARLGLLMLDNGKWDGKQIVPSDWIHRMTTLVTPFSEINPTFLRNYGEPARWGYGLLWWVWEQPVYPGNSYTGYMQGAYSAMGTGGTFITVLPGPGLVIVHLVDIDKNNKASVSPSSYMAMVSMVMNSWCGDKCN